MVAQKSRAALWRNAPGIVGSGVGLTATGQPVIDVFTTRPGVALPQTLGGVRVRPVVTGMIVARSAKLRYPRPVPIGVSAGLADFATGTLGARVTNGTNVYALSNNHVFAGVNQGRIGDPILQPGPIEDGGVNPADRIGTLADFQQINFSGGANTMDAAIALTTTADVGVATLPDGYGPPSATTLLAAVGMQVQKYGRTTGYTTAAVNALNVDVDVCYFPLTETICFPGYQAHFTNQFSVADGAVPFSGPGDSGSLLVTLGSNNPVGLLFAGGEGLTIANPIDAVLQRFNVAIDGSPAEDGPPAAPTGLGALAGDGNVSLAWTAPTFDGGSPVTSYNVYRGTSAGGESFLTGSTTTSFVDASAQNGTTYYYKVSAVNANGEGSLSNEASATPTSLVLPTMPLTTVDGFDRANESPLVGGWTNGISATGGVETGLNVTSNTLACSKSTTCTAWRTTPQYGPDVEVWARVSTLPGTNNHIRLYARLQGPGASTYDGYMLRTNELAGATDQIFIERIDNGSIVNRLTVNQELAVGDVLLLRAKGSSLEIWRNAASTWTRLGVVSDTTYAAAGYAGIGLRGTTGRLDDFGARTLGLPPPTPPSAPQSLQATAGNAQVVLSWSAPSSNGGSTLTGYTVYRGTAPNPTSVLQAAVAGTGYTDLTAANGTTYYYRVTASNAVGESGYSNEVQSTPTGPVPPVEPLSILDSFNRANENPLTFGGRWGNGILGAPERSLKVLSNQCASDRNTTATAWWTTPLAANQEAYATMATLPGNGNSVRLYVRLQTPGSSAVDGYMLLYTQQSGTDQVVIYRITNGALTALSTVNREIGAGSRLLLRAKGTALEVWVREATWSRIATATDSTYTGGGFVGIGIRDKTGRLDDFGAR